MLDKITSLFTNSENPADLVNDESLKERMGNYTSLILSKDIQGLLTALVDDMDKEALQKEVDEEKKKFPNHTPSQLAEAEVNRTAKYMSGTAITSGIAALIPLVGNVTGPLATSVEIVSLFVLQSRMVVKIACYFDKDPNSAERLTDILVGIAGTTGGASSRLMTVGIQKVSETALQKGLEKVAEKVAVKMGEGASQFVPGAGNIIGAVGGLIGATTNYVSVKSVGEITIRRYGGKTENLEVLDSIIIDVAIVSANATGRIVKKEKDGLTKLIKNSCLSDDLQSRKMKQIKSEFSIDDINFDIDKSEKLEVLSTVLTVSLFDNNLHYKEMQLLFTIGDKLDFSISELNTIVDEFMQERKTTK
ncbi:MAG: hypothetical protein HRT89_09540 [Lentisphaeria bacterium]|nr:hypothetical protein [Lentisphaeria bacterium]